MRSISAEHRTATTICGWRRRARGIVILLRWHQQRRVERLVIGAGSMIMLMAAIIIVAGIVFHRRQCNSSSGGIGGFWRGLTGDSWEAKLSLGWVVGLTEKKRVEESGTRTGITAPAHFWNRMESERDNATREPIVSKCWHRMRV